MSTKYINFMAALNSLCKEHGVTITTSMYDSLQVWDAKVNEELRDVEDWTMAEHAKGFVK